MKQLKTKVLIIGAGASGMALALYLKRASVPFILSEKSAPGGKLNQLSNIDNYLGFSHITGPELAMKFYEQITLLKIEILNEEVLKIKKQKSNFLVYTSENIIQANFIVFATGVMMKKIDIPGYDSLLHKGISSCAVCDGYLYKSQPILVVGDSKIANHEYRYLTSLSNKVYQIDNKKEKVIKFVGTNHLEKVVTNKKTYQVQAAFIYDDEAVNEALSTQLNLKLINKRILVNEHYETSVSHVYAIGDAIKKELYQVVGAINDASIASVNIIKSISNEKY